MLFGLQSAQKVFARSTFSVGLELGSANRVKCQAVRSTRQPTAITARTDLGYMRSHQTAWGRQAHACARRARTRVHEPLITHHLSPRLFVNCLETRHSMVTTSLSVSMQQSQECSSIGCKVIFRTMMYQSWYLELFVQSDLIKEFWWTPPISVMPNTRLASLPAASSPLANDDVQSKNRHVSCFAVCLAGDKATRH